MVHEFGLNDGLFLDGRASGDLNIVYSHPSGSKEHMVVTPISVGFGPCEDGEAGWFMVVGHWKDNDALEYVERRLLFSRLEPAK
jgi:hypothetical protein